MSRASARDAARILRLVHEGQELLVLSVPLEPSPVPLPRALREVARTMVRGASNAEIAYARGTSTRTVANQVAAILRRLGVDSRGQAAATLAKVDFDGADRSGAPFCVSTRLLAAAPARRVELLAPARRAAAVPKWFSRALRSALRGLHETRKLAQSPLLGTHIVGERAGANACVQGRVQALREMLCDGIRSLGRNHRTEGMHRTLFHTYLEPAPSQLLAAEAARMSFGTYRRHLAAATAELATMLWLRESMGG